MSHVATIDVKITDIYALKEACVSRGWSFHEGKTSYRWYGRWVGDTAFTPEMFDTVEEYEHVKAMTKQQQQEHMTKSLGRCDHVISIPGCTYDLGVQRKPDGTFRLVWDYWHSGGLEHALGGQGAPKLVQAYATSKMIAEASRLGHHLESQDVLEDGTVRLRLVAARY